MKRLLALAMLGAAAPGLAQSMNHDMHAMPGHKMPGQAAPVPESPHAGHDHMPTAAPAVAPVGDAQPPEPAKAWAADPLYPAGTMAAARAAMLAEHGGMRFAQLMVNIAEIGPHRGGNSYRWDAEGWFGGDIDRLVVKSEGHGRFGTPVDDAEAQALWSHAVDPYWNLQAGIRQDFRSGRAPTHLALGVEGLAPYWFEVEATLFLSNRGRLQGRVEAYLDQRLTQRLILQPRVELNLAAQDDAATGAGSGLSDAELGLRLRYEIRREFAPYVGVSHDRRFGDAARFARAAGEAARSTRLVAGVRFWF